MRNKEKIKRGSEGTKVETPLAYPILLPDYIITSKLIPPSIHMKSKLKNLLFYFSNSQNPTVHGGQEKQKEPATIAKWYSLAFAFSNSIPSPLHPPASQSPGPLFHGSRHSPSRRHHKLDLSLRNPRQCSYRRHRRWVRRRLAAALSLANPERRRQLQADEVGRGDKEVVREYFNNDGFQRWRRIYEETYDVNKVQRDIRLGHSKTVDNTSAGRRPWARSTHERVTRVAARHARSIGARGSRAMACYQGRASLGSRGASLVLVPATGCVRLGVS
ncbi:magnesium-protoporphyrin IX methyltransferase [Striga asiatica]|uniref:Magnesium-protoporphyrin IX methyltransferase n=1 Tax=Striga asiatica TaxID=4170 RepID=A0A5A7QKD8_STRAF|nr:magnesium-protoporphyrin IX methyltransferase [Striga asiatica]